MMIIMADDGDGGDDSDDDDGDDGDGDVDASDHRISLKNKPTQRG